MADAHTHRTNGKLASESKAGQQHTTGIKKNLEGLTCSRREDSIPGAVDG